MSRSESTPPTAVPIEIVRKGRPRFSLNWSHPIQPTSSWVELDKPHPINSGTSAKSRAVAKHKTGSMVGKVLVNQLMIFP